MFLQSTGIRSIIISFIVILISYFSLSAQNNEIKYGFRIIYTSDVIDYGSFQNPKKIVYKPSKYVIYVSKIYSGNSSEIEDKLDSFSNKYGKFLKKYETSSPPHLGGQVGGNWEIRNDINTIKKLRTNKIDEYKAKGYEVIVLGSGAETRSQTKKILFSKVRLENNFYVDGYYTLKYKFVFNGYPYILSKYEDLTITNIRYQSDYYSVQSTSSGDMINLPYKVKSKPFINADFWVWTPKFVNANPIRKREHQVFQIPVKQLARISDNYSSVKADNYFKSFSGPESDSYFWENSLLKNPKVSSMNTYTLTPVETTSFTGVLKQELKSILKKKSNYQKELNELNTYSKSYSGGWYGPFSIKNDRLIYYMKAFKYDTSIKISKIGSITTTDSPRKSIIIKCIEGSKCVQTPKGNWSSSTFYAFNKSDDMDKYFRLLKNLIQKLQ